MDGARGFGNFDLLGDENFFVFAFGLEHDFGGLFEGEDVLSGDGAGDFGENAGEHDAHKAEKISEFAGGADEVGGVEEPFFAAHDFSHGDGVDGDVVRGVFGGFVAVYGEGGEEAGFAVLEPPFGESKKREDNAFFAFAAEFAADFGGVEDGAGFGEHADGEIA